MAGNGATFKQKTVQTILQKNFKDEKTKVNSDALVLVGEVLRVFVAEAASRAASQAKKDASDEVTIDYFEKILPQLMLDM
ncbi:centromere protein X-like isoform X2 [Haliotis rubra]|uniref:centromere protein X-like isoform X1 n=1 Tax=Haliotis rubra TaxID=36100 RepID=UPI001EE5F08D|nr:centromere protein X-like isoform X1 [Haliotis rubra]XP_046553765.1 centromere protein X-like isoform X2 [Haliotis rubra]